MKVCPDCGSDEFTEYAQRPTWQPFRVDADGECDYDEFEWGDDVFFGRIECNGCPRTWDDEETFLASLLDADDDDEC